MVVNLCKSLNVELQEVALDTADGEGMGMLYKVCSLPTIIVLDNEGREMARNEGEISQAILAGMIKGEW